MATAINFDGIYSDDNQPIGRDVATLQFIRAFFRFSNQEKFPCVCPDQKSLDQFQNFARLEKIEPDNCYGVNQNDATELEKLGQLFRFDPNIVKHFWARRKSGQKLYSITGLLHTCATNNVMEILGQYVLAPTQSWDAVICPSNAIKSAALTVVENWQDYLKERSNATLKCPMKFPVIPLGIDAEHFDKITTEKHKNDQRKNLGLEPDEIAILYAGRLNFIAKANPISLLRGVEEAAIKTKTPVRLIFYGYFNDELNEIAFTEAAENLCSLAKVSFIKHGDANFPDGFWAGADIFCSLADNIQESFGLTPIEAMASGLPVVVSDWDGYRDTVRDGVDGYTIKTLSPHKGYGEKLAYKYFSGQYSYGDYLAATQQAISVDAHALTSCLIRLIEIPDLRTKMGEAGKQRANLFYDWSRIIPSYQELWLELNDYRMSDQEINAISGLKPFHPSYPDPFTMFDSFPSHHIKEDGKIELHITNWPEAMKLISLKAGYVIADSLIELEELPFLFENLEKNTDITIKQLVDNLPDLDPNKIILTVAWLIKLGICRYNTHKQNKFISLD